MSNPLRVMIATPCTDSVKAGFALDLAMLYGLVCRHSDDVEAAIMQNRGTIIPQQRATLVDAAQRYGATHLLWLDSDMRFPKDTLFRLLKHNQPIVAANYARRRHPALPTAEHRDKGHLFSTDDATGLEAVTQCGFGVMLTRMDVFQKISEPWFQIGYTSNDHQYVGEDFFFCAKARKAGFEILIDHDLSKEIRHVGEMDYTHQHTAEARAYLMAQEHAAAAPKLEIVPR
jgi:hypothetical protein